MLYCSGNKNKKGKSLHILFRFSVSSVFNPQFIEPFHARPTDTEVRIYSAVSYENMNLELNGTLWQEIEIYRGIFFVYR